MAALVTMPGATGTTTSSEDASAAGLTMVHPASDDGQSSSSSPGAGKTIQQQQPTEGILKKAPRRKRRQRHLEDSSQGSSSSSSSSEEEAEGSSSVLMMRRTMAAAAAILTNNPPVEVRPDEASSRPAPSDGQLFSLRWHDFQSSILSSFRHLRDSEDFVDVTLACDGGRYFTAHKMVLSACSPYFRHLLKANPCQHPIVILRDVKHRDMETLLRFMYNGEVSVSNEQLPSVLATARTLQVKGLADVIPNASGEHPPQSGITTVDNNKQPNNNNNLAAEQQQQQLHIHHNNNNNNKRVMDYAAGNEAAGSSSRESSIERSSRKRAREDVAQQASVIPPLIRNGLAEDEEDDDEEEDEMEDEDLMDSEEERMRLLEAHRESLLSQALEGRSSQSLMAHLMATRRTSGNQSEASSVGGGNTGPNSNNRAMMQHLHHSSGGHHPNDDDASDTDDTDASDRDRTDVGDLSNMDDNVYPSSGLMGDLHHHGQHPLHRSSSGQHFGGDGMHPPSSGGGSYGGSGSHHPLLNLQGLHSLFPGGSNGPSGRDGGGHNSSNSDLANATRRSLDLMRIRATDPRPCPQCGKIYRSAHTLRTHLEDKHTVCPGYRCVLCGTVAKSRNSLHSHMSRQHRGISTKDLPVVPMPAPFDPVLASCLLAKAGVKVSPAELAARASPTSGNPRGRTADLRLDFKSPHSSGGSLTPGSLPPQMMYNINQKVTIGGLQSHRNNPLQLIPLDAQDAEDLSLAQQRLRDQSSSGHHRDHHHHHQHHHHRRENKGEESSRGGERSSMATISPYGPAGSDRGGSGSAAAGLVNRLGLSGKAGKQWLESNMAAAAAIQQQQQQQAGSPGGNNPSGNAAGTGSALLDTYLQLIAEHSSNMAAAAAAAAAAAQQQQQSGRGGGHNDDDSPLMDSPKTHQLTGE